MLPSVPSEYPPYAGCEVSVLKPFSSAGSGDAAARELRAQLQELCTAGLRLLRGGGGSIRGTGAMHTILILYEVKHATGNESMTQVRREERSFHNRCSTGAS